MVYEARKTWQSLLRNGRSSNIESANYLGWYYAAVAQMELPPAERPSARHDVVDSSPCSDIESTNFPLAPFQLGRLLLQQRITPGPSRS
jgi:hypothetical protein